MPLTFGKYELSSRLILGTGKYETMELMEQALEASGTQMVTVAVRRVNLSDRSQPSLLDHIDTDRYTILPNTAGCYSADDAIRTARLAREFGFSDLVKVDQIPVPSVPPHNNNPNPHIHSF